MGEALITRRGGTPFAGEVELLTSGSGFSATLPEAVMAYRTLLIEHSYTASKYGGQSGSIVGCTIKVSIGASSAALEIGGTTTNASISVTGQVGLIIPVCIDSSTKTNATASINRNGNIGYAQVSQDDLASKEITLSYTGENIRVNDFAYNIYGIK